MGLHKKLTKKSGQFHKDLFIRRVETKRAQTWDHHIQVPAPATADPEVELIMLNSLAHGRRVKMWPWLNKAGSERCGATHGWSALERPARAKLLAVLGHLIKLKCLQRKQAVGEICITDAGYARIAALTKTHGPTTEYAHEAAS